MTMQYAVIKTGGKQYRVSKGETIEVDKVDSQGKDIVLSEVLLFVADGKVKVGKPFLSNITIKASLLEHIKGEKVRVAKFKAKARHRRVSGFRADLSRLEIKDIISGEKSASTKTSVKKTVKK